MKLFTSSDGQLDQVAVSFYQGSMTALQDAGVPFLVGGAYALARYAGIIRHTKDFDIFGYPADAERALATLAALGYETELTFPHWLGKAYAGEYFVDVIFSAGNGVAEVDDVWFEHGVDEEVLDMPVKLIPVEEMIWSKAFVMERERCDVNDVMHLFRACAEDMDWDRLLARFNPYWQVLLSYVILFDFVYPGERQHIPGRVYEALLDRLARERQGRPLRGKLCQGTLLARAQYLIDIEDWGYRDARLMPRGNMTQEDIELWTAAIGRIE